MFNRRNTRYYAKKLAKKHGVTVRQANLILSYGMRNIMRMIETKEDVRLPGLGRLWIDKPSRPRKGKTKAK